MKKYLLITLLLTSLLVFIKLKPKKHVFSCQKYLSEINNNQPTNIKPFFSDLDQPLVCYIQTAKTSVDLHFYQANLENLKTVLKKAYFRGVKIRFITDDIYYNDRRFYTKFYLPLMEIGIPIIHDQKTTHTNGQSHNKFVIIDNKYVWTGSYNPTYNGTYKNINNGILISSPLISKIYTKEFNEMWGSDTTVFNKDLSRFGTQKLKNTGIGIENKIEVCFDPSDECINKIIEKIGTANIRIDFAIFSFTDDDISKQILKKDIKVRGIFNSEETPYGQYKIFKKKYGQNILLKDDLKDPPNMIHHKFIVIDGDTDSDPIVITGSKNLTRSADTINDENTLIIHDKDTARLYLQEIDRLFEK